MESVRMDSLHNILRRSFRGVRFPFGDPQKAESKKVTSWRPVSFLFISVVLSYFLGFLFRLYSLILFFFGSRSFNRPQFCGSG
ncbi:hypothetical protein BDV32DRAFT_117899 [Aspergillus pseudonomiae]|nr:hypothetical protein BDV32DRAFT_117899 [Aspergillus pseudonomiae]